MCQTKLCTNCKETKDSESFGKSKRTPDGKQHQCKQCVNAKKRILNSKRVIPEYTSTDIKTCSKCRVPKSFSEFNKSGRSSIGINSTCKKCLFLNRQLRNKENKVLPTHKTCTKCNTEKQVCNFVKDISKVDGIACVCKSCTNTHKTQRLKVDITFRLSNNIRKLITSAFKNCSKGIFTKNTKTENILNTSFLNLRLNIESQFLAWMSWDNYGKYNGNLNVGFDLDHIIPISYAKTEEDIYLLNHWSNFQPLCSKVNRDIKKATIYPCTNLELGITFWEDHYEYINLD